MGAGELPLCSYLFFPQSEKWLTSIIARIWSLGGSQEAVADWLKEHPTIQIVARDRSGEGLDTWLKDVRASTVREFHTFARSVERDKAAILAGLTLPYSTGPVTY